MGLPQERVSNVSESSHNLTKENLKMGPYVLWKRRDSKRGLLSKRKIKLLYRTLVPSKNQKLLLWLQPEVVKGAKAQTPATETGVLPASSCRTVIHSSQKQISQQQRSLSSPTVKKLSISFEQFCEWGNRGSVFSNLQKATGTNQIYLTQQGRPTKELATPGTSANWYKI